MSTTGLREVAIGEFTVPPGLGGPAGSRSTCQRARPAWAPPIGDRALAYQGELLLGREVRLAVRDSDVEAGIVVVHWR